MNGVAILMKQDIRLVENGDGHKRGDFGRQIGRLANKSNNLTMLPIGIIAIG